MSQAASQAAAFYREVAASRSLWTVRDDGGFPQPMGRSGRRSQPFWPSRDRAERIIPTVPAYAGFTAVEITWDQFQTTWVPRLERDKVLVGVNWSGPRATGYDVEPADVLRNVAAVR